MKFHLLPSKYLKLPERERAFIDASVLLKIEQDKKRESRVKRGRKKK